MKVVVFKAHFIFIPFLFLIFYSPSFAQTTVLQSLPTALKLSVFKKDKLLYETILTANSEDSLVMQTKKGLFKCSKKKIIEPNLLKSMVTADGSEKLTIIQLQDTASLTTTDLSSLKIRISPQQTSRFSIERIGSLEIDSNNKKGIAFYYNHPTFKDSLSPSIINFEIFVTPNEALSLRGDQVTKGGDSTQVLKHFSMPILYSGIVMVHGLNSSSKEFKALSSYLLKRKYQSFQLNAINYPDSLGFSKNMQVIPKAIDSLLKVMEDNHVSASKVDLIGHSMGGIMSRLYVQGEGSDRKDVNRLITCNTPHSGSPVANFVRDSSNNVLINRIRHMGNKRFNLKSIIPDPNSQAVIDLQVGSDAIEKLLNGERMNYNKVSCHAICTERILPQLAFKSRFIKTFFTIFTDENSHADIHDGVVPMKSQRGGLDESCTSCIKKQWHSLSVANKNVEKKILELLQTDPLSKKFTTGGFKPVKLVYLKP